AHRLPRNPKATLRRSSLVLRPLPGGKVQRLYGRDLPLRDDPDLESTVGVQLRDSDGLGILSQEDSDEDLQYSALKPDPNELASEPVGVALIHRTHLGRGWRLPGINPFGVRASGSGAAWRVRSPLPTRRRSRPPGTARRSALFKTARGS